MARSRATHKLSSRTGPAAAAILRPRLLETLAVRFDIRLLTLVGAAGYGKSTVLSQAVEQNRLTTAGRDIWLGCEPQDSDAEALGQSILHALGSDPGRLSIATSAKHSESDLAALVCKAVVDAVWELAPFDVALILDDVHLIEPHSSGANLVEALAAELPSNGHLVLASRQAMTFPLSRLRASFELIEVNQTDLEFDDAELESFRQLRPQTGAAIDGSPRWPAFVALADEAGSQAAVQYLRDEILFELTTAQRAALAKVALFSTVDEPLLDAICGPDLNMIELLKVLPLVETGELNLLLISSLWAEALVDEQVDAHAALVLGGRHLLQRGRLLRAGQAFAKAQDIDGLTATAHAMCFRPLTNSWVDDARKLLRLLPPALSDSGAGALLSAFAELEMRHQWKAVAAFERAANQLKAEQSHELEVQALFVASQVGGIRYGLPPAPHLHPRAVELAELEIPLAISMVARFDACVALMEGDPIRAMSYADKFSGFGLDRSEMLVDQLWIDAGYPEHAGQVTTTPSEVEQLVAEREVNTQLTSALWSRGEISPELGMQMAPDLVDLVAQQRISHQLIQILNPICIAALAAGEQKKANGFAERARQAFDPDLGKIIGAYIGLIEAHLMLDRGDEDAAATQIRIVIESVPLGKWPQRPYMCSLSQLYLLVPECRPLLDSMRVGPALSEVINATRSLVSYRETGDPSPLEDIDWRRIGALRANISLVHLAEIALAARVDLESELIDESQRIRIPRRVLNILAKSRRPVAALAKDSLGTMLDGPAFELKLCVLGSLQLIRDGQPIEDDNWQRRERVRTLCGYLVHHPNALRRDVAAALWPDLEESKAQSNLRVNLRSLQQALEPDRPSGAPSWFIESEGATLNLRSDRILIDSIEFDSLVDRARAAEAAGVPGQALELYRDAVDLYQGEYLEDRQHDHWAEFERIRYRSAASAGAARVAELLLARGEPEASMRYASIGLALEPLLERAHRCRIRALLGLEDRGAARDAGRMLIASIGEADLSLEPDSAALMLSLGLATELRSVRTSN